MKTQSYLSLLGVLLPTTLLVGCSGAEGEANSKTQNVTTECSGLQSWVGNDWRLSFSAGEVIEHQGQRYQANQDINYPNAECAPDDPTHWCTNWFTPLGACGADPGPDPGPGPDPDPGEPPPPAETCSDGIQNQGEAGVDCGGPCAPCQAQGTGPSVSFSAPQGGQSFDANIPSVVVQTADPDGIANVRLYVNDTFVRQENYAPYQWGSDKDGALSGLPPGAYELTAVSTDNAGESSESSVTVTINGGGTESQPGDCTLTSQCKQRYDGATDCKNNLGGVCYCGNSVCTSDGSSGGGNPGGGNPGGGPNSQLPTPPQGYRWVLQAAYSDEFDGNSLDRSKWLDSFRNGKWKGRKPALFVPYSISVTGGNLKIQNGHLSNPHDGWKYYGGAVTSVKDGAHFGYYESRFISSATEMSSTFWLASEKANLPGTCQTYSQELDIVESIGSSNNSSYRNNMMSNTHFRTRPCGVVRRRSIRAPRRTSRS